jgi:hypothetical protein
MVLKLLGLFLRALSESFSSGILQMDLPIALRALLDSPGGWAEQARQLLLEQTVCLKPLFLFLILGLLLKADSVRGVPFSEQAKG